MAFNDLRRFDSAPRLHFQLLNNKEVGSAWSEADTKTDTFFSTLEELGVTGTNPPATR